MDYKSQNATPNKRQGLRNRFKMQQVLGEGTYGKVRLAIDRNTGIKYAIKTIRKNRISSGADLTRIRREIEIMTRLGHPHIISVQEVYENREKIVLVMEYASGGELYEYINTKGAVDGLPDHEARKFFRQIVSAVYYLHQNGIVHRDLKLENIFIDCRGYAKIGDFGLANLFEEGQCLKTFCGSPLYASPEIVNGRPYVGPEADCWSLGVLLYTLVYGAMPFDGTDFNRLRAQISQALYFQPAHKSEASDLIRQLLTVDVSLRATPEDAATHWWTNLGYTGTPIDNYSCLGRPVDYHKLKAIVHIDESSSCPQKSASTVSIISNSQMCHSPRGSVEDSYHEDDLLNSDQANCNQNSKSKPRGILKKSNATSEDEAICMSMSRPSSCGYDTGVCASNESVEQNIESDMKNDRVAHDNKRIYDSERRPKKSILKNTEQPNTFDEQMDRYYRVAECCSASSPYDIEANANDDYINDLRLNNDEINVMDYFTKSTPPYCDNSYRLSSAINDNALLTECSNLNRQLQLTVNEALTVNGNDTLTTLAPSSAAYDSGISEPNSLSQQDEWCGRRWDQERTDSQESNMSLGSSLWGGSSHSSAPPAGHDESGGEESSSTSTVVFPLYDMSEIENAITVITDGENNERLDNNILVGVDEFGNEQAIDRRSPNTTALLTERTLCDHECNISASPSNHYLYHINSLLQENNQLKGILKKQSVFPHDAAMFSRGNRHSYGSTASSHSHCSSLDNSRHRDDLYGSSPRSAHSYHDDEAPHDYPPTSETLHRDNAKPNMLMNLLQQPL